MATTTSGRSLASRRSKVGTQQAAWVLPPQAISSQPSSASRSRHDTAVSRGLGNGTASRISDDLVFDESSIFKLPPVSPLGAVAEIDHAVAETAFVQEFELQADIAWEGTFSASHHNRRDEQVTLVDQPGPERVGGEL